MTTPSAENDEFFGSSDLDIYVSNVGDDAIWINNGDGVFSRAGAAFDTGDSRISALGDIDGDGDLDVVVANSGGSPNEVWLNNGAGVFVDSGQWLGSSSDGEVALGDPDGEGRCSQSELELGTGDTRAVLVGDLDGDGGAPLFAGLTYLLDVLANDANAD